MKIRNPEKYEYAFLLFMGKSSQKDICAKVAITPATLQKWKSTGDWDQKRLIKETSFDELTTKILNKASTELDKEDFDADAFSKILSQLKKFKGGITPSDRMQSLMDFGDWLIAQSSTNSDVDWEFVKRVTKCQDLYLLTLNDNGKN